MQCAKPRLGDCKFTDKIFLKFGPIRFTGRIYFQHQSKEFIEFSGWVCGICLLRNPSITFFERTLSVHIRKHT